MTFENLSFGRIDYVLTYDHREDYVNFRFGIGTEIDLPVPKLIKGIKGLLEKKRAFSIKDELRVFSEYDSVTFHFPNTPFEMKPYGRAYAFVADGGLLRVKTADLKELLYVLKEFKANRNNQWVL